MYDTLGLGRTIRQSYKGGSGDGIGGWYRMQMPRESQGDCNMAPPLHPHTDSCVGNKSLASVNTFHYAG